MEKQNGEAAGNLHVGGRFVIFLQILMLSKPAGIHASLSRTSVQPCRRQPRANQSTCFKTIWLKNQPIGRTWYLIKLCCDWFELVVRNFPGTNLVHFPIKKIYIKWRPRKYKFVAIGDPEIYYTKTTATNLTCLFSINRKKTCSVCFSINRRKDMLSLLHLFSRNLLPPSKYTSHGDPEIYCNQRLRPPKIQVCSNEFPPKNTITITRP